MPIFAYKARDTRGLPVAGKVEAPSASNAAELLRKQKLFVISITDLDKTLSLARFTSRVHKVSTKEVANFTRQFSTMITAGLSIPNTLTILKDQSKKAVLSDMLGEIERHITGGGTLADAFLKYPSVFSPIYISLIRAGETSGTLDKVLERLAETLEAREAFHSKIKGALIYPVIILIAMVGVSIFMFIYVIPKLTDTYKDMGATLPLSTKILIGISNFLIHDWWLLIILIGVGIFLFRKWKKTLVGEFMFDTFLLKIPIFGDLEKKIMLVEFTRTLGMLVGSGIHILQALTMLKDTLGNVRFRLAVEHVAKKVERGFALGETFAEQEEFPQIFSQMMRVGEETGRLDLTLEKLSKYFQSESDNLVQGLTAAMEPLIMIVLGLGVGFLVISIITPIYNLSSQIK